MKQSRSIGDLVNIGFQNLERAFKSQPNLLDHSDEEEDIRPYPTDPLEYELLEDVGRGTSATVYRALCKRYNEPVAIKVTNLETTGIPMEDCACETRAMKGMRHPYILPLYTSFVAGQELWMVTPFMEGGSIAHLIRYAHPEGLEEVLIASIMLKVLKGLAYIHTHNAIHRDIKAGNILIDADGTVKVADFGVAATLERIGETRTTFKGTPNWMAPEVLEQSSYGAAADIWSFGITLLELAHGHAPFSRYPPMKVLLMTLQGPPPQLEARCGERHFSRAMREVVSMCLQKDPAHRATAAELLEHRFFRQARDCSYIRRALLDELPALPDRVNAIRAGKAATDGRKNDLAAAKSTMEYMKGVVNWDFSCVLKPEGEAGPSHSQSTPCLGADAQPPSAATSSIGGSSAVSPFSSREPSPTRAAAAAGATSAAAGAAAGAAAAGGLAGVATAAGSGGHPGEKVTKHGRFLVHEDDGSATGSLPSSREASPTHARPAAAPPPAVAPAAGMAGGGARSVSKSADAVKKHGRFVVHEGPTPYHGPDAAPDAQRRLDQATRQRSMSVPAFGSMQDAHDSPAMDTKGSGKGLNGTAAQAGVQELELAQTGAMLPQQAPVGGGVWAGGKRAGAPGQPRVSFEDQPRRQQQEQQRQEQQEEGQHHGLLGHLSPMHLLHHHNHDQPAAAAHAGEGTQAIQHAAAGAAPSDKAVVAAQQPGAVVPAQQPTSGAAGGAAAWPEAPYTEAVHGSKGVSAGAPGAAQPAVLPMAQAAAPVLSRGRFKVM